MSDLPTKPTLLWMGSSHSLSEASQSIKNDLMQGYHVIYDVMDRNDLSRAVWMAHRYMADFILVEKNVRRWVIAYIKANMPLGCTLLRINSSNPPEYERIVSVDPVTAPWVASTDTEQLSLHINAAGGVGWDRTQAYIDNEEANLALDELAERVKSIENNDGSELTTTQ